MSRATLAVRFPDGTIRYGVYSGTSDLAYPTLNATVREAWDGHGIDPKIDDGDEVQPVEIATNYGDGFWWRGTASRFAISAWSCDPYGILLDRPGCPPGEWEAHRERVAMQDGRPDWWT